MPCQHRRINHEHRKNARTVVALLTIIIPAAAAFAVPPDFNGDGYADLAVGVPCEANNGRSNAGLVHVLYGSIDQLGVDNDQAWRQDSVGLTGKAELGDAFGAALAWGDFDGDGYDDLVIGAFGESIGGAIGAGSVTVLYGSPLGLDAMGNQVWTQKSPGLSESCQAGDCFGFALISGVPEEDFDGVANAGEVHVLYGSFDGLSATGSQLWNQASAGIQESPEIDDRFGSYLMAGDLNGDGADDLAIGVPFEDDENLIDTGIVHVLYGSVVGLTTLDCTLLNQHDSSLIEQPEPHDQYGSTLSIADFNGDGYDDLAVGVSHERIGTIRGAGAAEVYYGHDGGVEDGAEQLWTQNTPGIDGQAAAGDLFGASLASGDFNNDGYADLAIGVPQDDVGTLASAGAVHVIFGSMAGLSTTGSQYLHQDIPGVPKPASSNALFSASLAAGDFNNDGFGDLYGLRYLLVREIGASAN